MNKIKKYLNNKKLNFMSNKRNLILLIPFYGYYVAFMKSYIDIFTEDDANEMIGMPNIFYVVLVIYHIVCTLYVATTIFRLSM